MCMGKGLEFYTFNDDNAVRDINEKHDYFLKKAMNIAFKSTCPNQKHGCVIVKDGDIISEGYNHQKIHMYHKCSVHAEVDALFKCQKKPLTDCDMYVVRLGPSSLGFPLKYSRPCPDCTKAIQKAKLRRVFYSTNFEFEERYIRQVKQEKTKNGFRD